MSWIKEARERWSAKMPPFWVKVKHFWTAILTVSGVICGLEIADIDLIKQILPADMAPIVLKVIHYAFAISVIGKYQAKLTKVDTKEQA